MFRFSVYFLGALVATGLTAADDPWHRALRFDYNGASAELAARHAAQPDDPRLAIAHASVLLARQPRTTANVDSARAVLERVAGLAPRGSDEAILAAFLVARIDQDHVSPPRLEAARAGYAALLRDHAGHPLADHAAVNLALLDTLGSPDPGSPAAIARAEELLAAVRTPSAKRELHFLLARLHWEFRRDAAAAVPNLVAGREIGFEQPYRNSDVDLMIGNLARAAGDRGLALRHYEAFLEAGRRDLRNSTVRRYVAELRTELQEVRP